MILLAQKVWGNVHSLPTNKTTEANFPCPPDHQTSIFTYPTAKFTLPQAIELGFFKALVTVLLRNKMVDKMKYSLKG